MNKPLEQALVPLRTTAKQESQQERALVKKSQPDSLSYELLHPRGTLSPDVDERLFGHSIDSLGLDEDFIQTSDIQYRFVNKIYDALGDAVEEGRLEEVRPTLRYFMHDIGNRLVAVLARAQQKYEERERMLREERNFFSFRGPIEKQCENETEHLKHIVSTLERGRSRLKKVLIEIIHQDEGSDEVFNAISQLKALKGNLDIALKKIQKIQSEGHTYHNDYGHTVYLSNEIRQLYSKISGQVASLIDVANNCSVPELSESLEKNIIDVLCSDPNLDSSDQKKQHLISQSFFGAPLDQNTDILLRLNAMFQILSDNACDLISIADKTIARYTRQHLGDILGNGE